MKKSCIFLIFACCQAFAQNPAITSWLQNTTGITGHHYVSGNPTPINDVVLANVQSVQYSDDWVYVSTNGIPAYITGPFLDGNPNLAGSQSAIFKFPLHPAQNTGTSTSTSLGNIGNFINGVALFDYRDGRSWNSTTNTLGGGPMNPPGNGIWNRDAIPAERAGFDCAKGHPAGTNYHHHQNPSAFNLDLSVISTICSTYPADGLYVVDPNVHSPLLGFAYDGFPIYGAYGYSNTDGTGGIVRMKSSYILRNITARNTLYTGESVSAGPAVSATYPLGYFKEDYEFIANANSDYLDIHNGRFCVTPEFPAGTYCYFTTVDANYNSVFPYVVGPTFYGNKTAVKVTSITETTTTYTPLAIANFKDETFDVSIAPNPAQDFIAVQYKMATQDLKVELIDALGKVVRSNKIFQGSTLSIIETNGIENGLYVLKISANSKSKTFKVIINE